MTPDDPLSQLRDIHLPPTGGFWPPAAGWWVLALAALITAGLLLWLGYRFYRRNHWLRLANAELARLEASAAKEPAWFAQLNTLLKRAARERYPEERPETQSGQQWVTCLLSHLPGDASNRQADIADKLVKSAWLPEPATEPAQALAFARAWLEAQKC